jgi:gliding motility-associated-like protein
MVKLFVTPTKCPQLARFIQKQIIVQASPANMKYPPANAVAGRDLKLQAREFSGATYQWSPSIGLSRISVADPIFNHTAEQQYLINIITAAGCQVTDTLLVRIFVEKKIYVPDYFTPNNDGKNDKMMPLLVGITRLTNFRIWNRWGQLVYQTQKQGEGWDGIYQGVKQPMETFLWIAEGLDIDGKIISATGSFILVR